MNSSKLVRNIMRAIRVTQFGGPEVLKVEDKVPIPTPKDNQVLITYKLQLCTYMEVADDAVSLQQHV